MKCKVETVNLVDSINGDGHKIEDVDRVHKLAILSTAVEKFFQENSTAKAEWHQTNAVEAMANWAGGRMAFSTTITVILTA